MKTTQVFTLNNKKFEASKAKPQKSLAGLGTVHSLLYVDRRYKFVKAGSIIKSLSGEKFLLAQHHTSSGKNIYNTMLVTGSVKLSRSTTIKHPVTKMDTERSTTQEIQVDVVYSRVPDGSDETLNIKQAHYILGTPVSSSDSLDGKRVKEVQFVHGVYLAETA